MEGSNNKIKILVAEINRMNEENQNLNSMLKRMSTSYNDLQKNIKSLVQRKLQVTRVDQSQIFNPDDLSEENFNLGILSPRSLDVHSHQSYNSSDCHERVREKEGKKAKFMDDNQLPSKKRKINYIQLNQRQIGMINSSMDDGLGAFSPLDCPAQIRKKEWKNAKVMDDQHLPSKKRKINYFQLEQTQNLMTIKSLIDDSLSCEEPRKKKHNALSKLSPNKHTAAMPKKIVAFR